MDNNFLVVQNVPEVEMDHSIQADSLTVPIIDINTPMTTPEEYINGIVKASLTGITPEQYLEKLRTSQDSETTSEFDGEVPEMDFGVPDNSRLDVYRDLRTGYCYDAKMRFHVEIKDEDTTTAQHPEEPRRILAIYRLLCLHGLIDNPGYAPIQSLVPRPLQKIDVRHATEAECCMVHTAEHFKDVRSTAFATDAELLQKSLFGDSVYYNQSTYGAALLAAGAAIDTTIAVVRGEVKNAIAIIRPPGHHSEYNSSNGFCHFDNVAIAVKNAQQLHAEIQKVLIVDWDVHHGNGIQQAFEEDPNVLYISIHVHSNGTFYPSGQYGSIASDGKGKGKGRSLNIAWSQNGMTDGDYLQAFTSIIMPVAREFDPDLVMVASGFDAAAGDELGGCYVTPPCYAQMTHHLMSLADGKVVVCLEGGYNLEAISQSALAVTKTLMGQSPPRVEDPFATKIGKQDLDEVIRHHHQYWTCLPVSNSTRFDNLPGIEKVHDLIRAGQALRLFQGGRMYNLPVVRATDINGKEISSESFRNQVLATSNHRRAQQLLVVFHGCSEVAGEADALTGEMALSSQSLSDDSKTFLDWGIKKGFGVIDVYLPDFYTGLSKTGSSQSIRSYNSIIRTRHLNYMADYVWDKYIEPSSARFVNLLGLGKAYDAVFRIFSARTREQFHARKIRGIGAVTSSVPYKSSDVCSIEHFAHFYSQWATLWVPGGNPVFRMVKNGKINQKFGDVRASQCTDLVHLIRHHARDMKNQILSNFELDSQMSSTEISADEDDGMRSDSSGGSGLGKRRRPREDDLRSPSKRRTSEER